jgi:hypothetical protein
MSRLTRLEQIEGQAIGDALRELHSAVAARAATQSAHDVGALYVAEVQRLGLAITDRDGSPLTAEALAADMHLLRDVRDAVRDADPTLAEPNVWAVLGRWVERGGDHSPVVAAVVRRFGHIAPPTTPPLALIGVLAALMRGEYGRSGAVGR